MSLGIHSATSRDASSFRCFQVLLVRIEIQAHTLRIARVVVGGPFEELASIIRYKQRGEADSLLGPAPTNPCGMQARSGAFSTKGRA